MTDTTSAQPVDRARASELGPVGRFLKATEIDTRMLGMVGALLLIWIGLHVMSGGLFLTPRNLWNLSVQTSSVAIMATGMVLVIVMRNIDLSVGSVEGLVGMIMGFAQVHFLVNVVGLGLGKSVDLGPGSRHWFGDRRADRRVPGFRHRLSGSPGLHRDARRPAGLARRGMVGHQRSDGCAARCDLPADGRRPARFDRRHLELGRRACRLPGRGAHAAERPGATQALQVPAAAGLGRDASRQRLPASSSSARCWIANSYPWPVGIVRKYAEANDITIPEGGLFIAHGIAIPVLIAVAVGIVMTFITTRTRFGRYVFAIGGNPEAANLAGINTRWVTMKMFVIMGMLGDDQRRDLVGPPQLGNQLAGHAGRVAGHRGCCHRRHVARRRRRARSSARCSARC